MCNIIEKRNKIELIANGIIPKEYRRDKEKRYSIEHDKYLAIKNEVLSCNDDERSNLEILFKCQLESNKRFYNIKDYAVFGITLLNLLLTCGSLVINSSNTAVMSPQTGELMVITVGIIVISLMIIVLYCQNNASYKLSDTLYILEIFKTCNKSESQ